MMGMAHQVHLACIRTSAILCFIMNAQRRLISSARYPSDLDMKHFYLWLLALLLFAASGCGPADRGENCGENSHRSIECADGLICVWQPTIQRQVCAAPGDESTSCEIDEDCHDENIFCFGNACQTQRDEDELCVEDRQCKGELVCFEHKGVPHNRIGHCWTKEEANNLNQCHAACMADYYDSCLAECRTERSERGEDETGCDAACELVEYSRPWQTQTSLCTIKCT